MGDIPRNELQKIINEMEKQMKDAAKNLEFERAAALRDEMYELKTLMAEDEIPQAVGKDQIAGRGRIVWGVNSLESELRKWAFVEHADLW